MKNPTLKNLTRYTCIRACVCTQTHTHTHRGISLISLTVISVCLSCVQQDSSVPVFSADQYSFSEFTMAMVKQCMQEEEVRSRHQSSLLRLRHRALKEKTRAELDWLELQKRQATPPLHSPKPCLHLQSFAHARTHLLIHLCFNLLQAHCSPNIHHHYTVTH